MLEVSGLSVTYGAVKAVNQVTFTVGDSECVALLGPNGAGKSSTLRALSGLGARTGTVTFEGSDLAALGPDRVAKLGLIHVPEGRRLFASLTVQENLQVAMTARGTRSSAYSVDDVYDLFPALVALRDTAAWSLSGGEQQMVAIGRGLVAGPRLLMLDEPSLGLAPLIRETVFAALRQIKFTTAILLVEQNTSLALTLIDRGYVLVGGEIVMLGSKDELADRAKMVDAYLGMSDVEP